MLAKPLHLLFSEHLILDTICYNAVEHREKNLEFHSTFQSVATDSCCPYSSGRYLDKLFCLEAGKKQSAFTLNVENSNAFYARNSLKQVFFKVIKKIW